MAEKINLAREMHAATTAAYLAGKIMLKYFNADHKVTNKSDGTPVTIADKAINEMVIDRLVREFPSYGVVGEEQSTEDVSQERVWYCDPIDGTKSFIRGIPTAMFSLGLVEAGRPVMGVAFDPFQNNIFTASQGGGSYKNRTRIHVSDVNLDQGVVGVSSNIARSLNKRPAYLAAMARKGMEMDITNGAVFKACLLASGKFAGYLEPVLGPHDVAAAEVIVAEAGGFVSGWDGRMLDYSEEFKGAIMANTETNLIELGRLAQSA